MFAPLRLQLCLVVLAVLAAVAVAARRLWVSVLYAGRPFPLPRVWQRPLDGRSLVVGPLFRQRFSRSTLDDPSLRLLIVHREALDSGIKAVVCGSKGALYTVAIGSVCTCDCPDRSLNLEGTGVGDVKHCKHIFFIKREMLRIPPSHPMMRRLGYAAWEVSYMAGHANLGVAKPSWAIQEAWKGTTTVSVHDPADTCKICYDTLGDALPVRCLVQCRTAYHAGCVESYKAHCSPLICAVCRTPWTEVEEVGLKSVVARGQTYASVGHLRPTPVKKRRGSKA